MKILIAEDDRAARVRLKGYLRDWGHEVAEAEDGAAAWHRFQIEAFDLVISDWLMPKMNGLELLKQIRSVKSDLYVYLILLTSKSGKEDIVEGMDSGADDFVTKPFDKDELRVRVRAGERILALEHHLANQKEDLKFANTRLEAANREIVATNERMKSDLEAAAKIQKSYLPDLLPASDIVHFAWRYLPCEELAGDTLNVMQLSENLLGMYLLDVSDHGVKASLMSVSLSRTLSRTSGQGDIVMKETDVGEWLPATPTEVAMELNHRYPWDPRQNQYFTFIYSTLDTEKRELTYLSAGHPGPIHQRADGACELLQASPPAVGFVSDPEFTEFRIQLAPGDRFFFYSDGITESMTSKGQELTEDGMMRLLEKSISKSLDESLSDLLSELEHWREGANPMDDISILAVEVLQ
ncbi:MAG: SpoIIE family protein phosphatase [Planctomycetota bacterium]|nr:SpoIIE family protein phosphatase [Planctomycetota bacterium]